MSPGCEYLRQCFPLAAVREEALLFQTPIFIPNVTVLGYGRPPPLPPGTEGKRGEGRGGGGHCPQCLRLSPCNRWLRSPGMRQRWGHEGGGGDEQGWGEEGRVMEGTGDGWGRGTDGDKAGMGVSR